MVEEQHRSAVAAAGQQAAGLQQDFVLFKINQHLQGATNFTKAVKVYLDLEAGRFDEHIAIGDDASERRLRSQNKLRLLPTDLTKRILGKFNPRLQEFFQDKGKPSGVLAVAMNCSLNCAVFSKDIAVLEQECMRRYRSVGEILGDVVPTTEWLKTFAFFVMVPSSAEGDKFDGLKHMPSGRVAEFSGADRSKDWVLTDGYDFEKAMMVAGPDMKMCKRVFEIEGVELEAPLKLSEVPVPSPTTPGSSVTLSDVSSPGALSSPGRPNAKPKASPPPPAGTGSAVTP